MHHTDTAQDAFLRAFRGSFTSALRWHQLDALWERVRERAGRGWYIYAVGEVPPSAPSDARQVETFIGEVDNLGVSCGYSDNPPLPGWVMSLIPPVDLPSIQVVPRSRRHWWQRLFD